MKSLFITMFILTTCSLAYAQKDSVDPSSPHGQYGTQRITEPVDSLKEDRIEIAHDKIPPRMKNTLERNAAYEGWEQGNVFYERNTDQYLVHIVKDNTTHTFRFDKEGNAIKTEQPIHADESRQ